MCVSGGNEEVENTVGKYGVPGQNCERKEVARNVYGAGVGGGE